MMRKQWILLVGVALVLSGCTLFQKAAVENIVSQVMRATEADFEFIQDPLIRKHFVAQANKTAYRISAQVAGGGTQMTEMQLEGDKFKFKMTNSQPQYEMIMINDTTYIKDFSDNAWWMQVAPKPKDQEQAQTTEEPEDFKEAYKEKQQMVYKGLGEEACGTMTCHKYEEADPSQAGYRRVFWLDKKDLWLRKEQIGGTTNEYAYDNVSVNVPSPTKAVPEGKNIYEYMFGGGGGGFEMPKDLPDYSDWSVPEEE